MSSHLRLLLAVLLVAGVAGCGQSAAAPAGTGGAGGAGAECVGPKPPQAAYDAEPGPVSMGGGAGGAMAADPNAVGAPIPVYQLEDYQPLSCGFEATYGLPLFKGKVTVAALLAGW